MSNGQHQPVSKRPLPGLLTGGLALGWLLLAILTVYLQPFPRFSQGLGALIGSLVVAFVLTMLVAKPQRGGSA